ncbi:MAG: hypothetical protein K0B09_11975 [Bacteroidales bacterium]|nr:hypothetical protein [Bacteroidales bacterium]
MKRKILALAFVAAMTLGLAKTASSDNSWQCFTISWYCFPWFGEGPGFSAYICGDTWEEQISMLEFYIEELCP